MVAGDVPSQLPMILTSVLNLAGNSGDHMPAISHQITAKTYFFGRNPSRAESKSIKESTW